MQMQMHKPTSSSSTSDFSNQHQNPDHFVDQSATKISLEFNRRLQLDENDESDSQKPLPDSAAHAEEFVDCEDEEEDEGDSDDDFTFMYLGQNDSPIPADELSENDQIRPVFPLFDQKLLSNRLPIEPTVEKVFVESNHKSPSSTSEFDEIESIAAGPYCTWSKQPATSNPDLGKKSNSTGFSKLWRLRDKVGRTNSDGRDAFVFLNSSGKTTALSKSVVKPTAVAGSPATATGAGGGKAKTVKKGKKANLSAHEVYLRKREQTEEERRRSYRPYRPELMGFFTNVNGGLSKNVHPY